MSSDIRQFRRALRIDCRIASNYSTISSYYTVFFRCRTGGCSDLLRISPATLHLDQKAKSQSPKETSFLPFLNEFQHKIQNKDARQSVHHF